MKFILDKISMVIIPNFNWLPPNLINKYYLALHSPNIIPEFKIGTNFIEIKPSTISKVTYCKIEKNYQSNCIDYEKGDDIRSDCVTICVIKRLRNEFHDVTSLYHSFLLRKEHFSKLQKFNKSRKFKYYNTYQLIDMREQCLKQCKPDCSFSYYLYDITTNEITPKSRH